MQMRTGVILCRVEIQGVSLALLVLLWTGVCAIGVPDKPGAVAHTREATRIMQYPNGCPPLRTLPSSQRSLLGRAEDRLHGLQSH